MEIKNPVIIRAPRIGPAKDWRDDMAPIRGAKQATFHANRWYSRDDEEGVVDYGLAPWCSTGGVTRSVANPGTEPCLWFVAGKGAKAAGLKAQCEHFYLDERLWQRLTWTDVAFPVEMQRVNRYEDMGDTSGKWERYGRQTAFAHIQKSSGNAIHIRRGEQIAAVWCHGRRHYHMLLPLEDPNDAHGTDWLRMKGAEKLVGHYAKERGLSIQRNRRLIYFVRPVKLTEDAEEAIGKAFRAL